MCIEELHLATGPSIVIPMEERTLHLQDHNIRVEFMNITVCYARESPLLDKEIAAREDDL